MATPRSQLVDASMPLFYHLVSRCVRQSWLCGTDRSSGKNYDHRKAWLEERLLRLASSFAIDLHGYAIMSNHFHLVVYYDPGAASRWSDEEVAARWIRACASISGVSEADRSALDELQSDLVLSDPVRLQRIRATLGSLSMFMKHLKQPIAWRANREDGCTGHFFESRFYSGALLDDAAVVAAMAYVDLNPVRAKLVQRAIDAEHTGLHQRLAALASDPDRLNAYLAPLVSGLESQQSKSSVIPIPLSAYMERLELFSNDEEQPLDREASWYQRVSLFKNKQRAYGLAQHLASWAADHGWSRVGMALVP